MDTQVVSPQPGQTVISTHTGHHSNHGHRDHYDRDFEILREQSAGFREDRREFGGMEKAICEAARDTALAACKTQDAVGAGFSAGQKQVSDAATSTLVGFKDLTALSYQIQGAGLLEAAKNAAALQVQATANANAASVEATKNFYALSVEAVKNASAAELRAQQVAAAAAAQAAECCCELKALITAESASTRALINDNTVQALRSQLASIPRGVAVTLPVGIG